VGNNLPACTVLRYRNTNLHIYIAEQQNSIPYAFATSTSSPQISSHNFALVYVTGDNGYINRTHNLLTSLNSIKIATSDNDGAKKLLYHKPQPVTIGSITSNPLKLA
jgi:hypothetical protein